MDNKKVIEETVEFVKSKLEGEGSGHDWWHVYRVWKSAIKISKSEKVDIFIVELGALLHDIADWKFNDGNDSVGAIVSSQWLHSLGVDEKIITHVADIVKSISFRGAKVESKMKTMEGKVVQDADRLDGMGAIGIARTFAYGGHKGREMYNPDIKPQLHETFEQYKNSTNPTINHFYEKLLLLKGLMNTDTAIKIAEGRHKYMEDYLNRFYSEWEGEV